MTHAVLVLLLLIARMIHAADPGLLPEKKSPDEHEAVCLTRLPSLLLGMIGDNLDPKDQAHFAEVGHFSEAVKTSIKFLSLKRYDGRILNGYLGSSHQGKRPQTNLTQLTLAGGSINDDQLILLILSSPNLCILGLPADALRAAIGLGRLKDLPNLRTLRLCHDYRHIGLPPCRALGELLQLETLELGRYFPLSWLSSLSGLVSLKKIIAAEPIYKSAEFVQLIRALAARKNPYAQNELAHMLRNGHPHIEKNIPAAIDCYHQAADQNDPKAQYRLGFSYLHGEGVRKDPVTAMQWFKMSAAQGFSEAHFAVGWMYSEGEGVEKDCHQALASLKMAARLGHDRVHSTLGVMFRHGNCVKKDLTEAIKWFQSGVSRGDKSSFVYLAQMLSQGQGVEKNDILAAQYFQHVANLGFAPAQNSLGVFYERGRGGEQSLPMAIDWYSRASEQGNAFGSLNLGVLHAIGKGVEKDEKAALKYFKLALQQKLNMQKANIADFLSSEGREDSADDQILISLIDRAFDEDERKNCQ